MLDALLSLYPVHARPISAIVPIGNAGGASGASLWRFESGLGPLVARAWPVDGPGLTILTRIHTWIGRLAGLPFIPTPITAQDGRTLIPLDGRFWEVTPWMPGTADLARPPASARLHAAFSALATLHGRWARHARVGESPGLRSRLDEIEALQSMELRLMAFAVSHAPADPIRDLSQRWLDLAPDGLARLVPRLERAAAVGISLQPILRDARPDHFLFEADRLTGLVDFGAMGVDTPSADLARLLTEWVGNDRPARTVALDAYTAIRPLSAREIELIDLYAESAAWLGPARWVRWHYIERRSFDDPDAVRFGLDRSLSRLIDRLTSSTP